MFLESVSLHGCVLFLLISCLLRKQTNKQKTFHSSFLWELLYMTTQAATEPCWEVSSESQTLQKVDWKQLHMKVYEDAYSQEQYFHCNCWKLNYQNTAFVLKSKNSEVLNLPKASFSIAKH